MKIFRNILLFVTFFSSESIEAQPRFSLSTDVSVLHNFDTKQKFTVVGQTIIPQFHFDKKNTGYIWFTYHSNGKYKSTLNATAKSASTSPPSYNFTNQSEMRLRQFSVGLKRFIKGGYDDLAKFNIYTTAGFGLIIGGASNTFPASVDTSLYSIQNNIMNGSGDFKRLTFDLGGGLEFPVSYEIYIYSEIRIHIPTTSYPNNYLLKNSNAPFVGTFNFGIRVSFSADP